MMPTLLKTISEIVSNSQLELLFMAISGHGYQQRDQDHDELDGMDEYIKINLVRLLRLSE